MPAPMPLTPDYATFAFASLWLSTLLVADGNSGTAALSCAAAGTFGGAITQLLTSDKRKPTRKVIIGEMMCSGLCGYGVFAYFGHHNPIAIVVASVAGGAGAQLWHMAVEKIQSWFGNWSDPI